MKNHDCTMQSIDAGIPKQSLGTRNQGRHSFTSFGNEKICTMQSIEAGIPSPRLGTRKYLTAQFKIIASV